MKPRQLRALVMLLVLLPLVPTAFVVRFLVEAIYNEHLESRERVRPVYVRLLSNSSVSLASASARQLPSPKAMTRAERTRHVALNREAADALLTVAADGTLSRWEQNAPPPLEEQPNAASERMVRGILDSGVRYSAYSPTSVVRWRFLTENPEGIFALRPAGDGDAAGGSLLLVKTRRHLLDTIAGFYAKVLDPQSVMWVVDENGDESPLIGPSGSYSGRPLAETMLPAPLPAWRVKIFSADSTFLDGLAREQIALSVWAVGGMVIGIGAIAGTAGLLLRRRISLQEMRNDILAIVSHEIKTPLASTRMFIDTLLERRYLGGPEQVDEYLRLIQQENSRLERLAEGFLTLSRLDRQRRRGGGLKLVSADADALCAEAAERLRPRLEAARCRFTLGAAAGPVHFLADDEALLVVLVNLLENALKYTGEDKAVSLRSFLKDGAVCFEVADNGIGIDAREQSRIFERFYQSDRRLARAHGGCGLGLSLVQSIVHAHGGTVAVQSAPGKGSTFLVRLPAGESGREAHAAAAAVTAAAS